MHAIAIYVATGLNAIAIFAVVVGALEALGSLIPFVIRRRATESERSRVYVHFARWLVAALTFQLGADIVETTVAPSWEEIGRVAAIAVIRTFLTYFLDRDLERAVEARRQEELRAKAQWPQTGR